jgi:type I restriction enzyme S subunit
MISNNKKKIKFSQIGTIITGKTPRTKIEEYWNGNVQFITPKDIQVNKSIFHTQRNISLEGLYSVKNIELNKGAIAISCIGNLGYVGKVIRKSITNQQINSIIPNKFFDSDYVFYLMKNYWPIFKSLENQSTTVSILNKTQFSNLEVLVFEKIETQKAIANILSTIDDKIEINYFINKNLEELVQTLYKIWFVDFEFPNDQGKPYKTSGGEMVDSELGRIPKGWTLETLGKSSISSLIKTGIRKFEGMKTYIATADVSDMDIVSFKTKITLEDKPSRANMQPVPNSLWFAKMKNSRKLIRVSSTSSYLLNSCIFSTGFAGLLVPDYPNYIWSYLISKEFDEIKNNLSNGTTMEGINNDGINRIKIIIPKKEIIKKFENTINSFYEEIQNLQIQNSKLSNLRDLLLPKLMSDEIEVQDME